MTGVKEALHSRRKCRVRELGGADDIGPGPTARLVYIPWPSADIGISCPTLISFPSELKPSQGPSKQCMVQHTRQTNTTGEARGRRQFRMSNSRRPVGAAPSARFFQAGNFSPVLRNMRGSSALRGVSTTAAYRAGMPAELPGCRITRRQFSRIGWTRESSLLLVRRHIPDKIQLGGLIEAHPSPGQSIWLRQPRNVSPDEFVGFAAKRI